MAIFVMMWEKYNIIIAFLIPHFHLFTIVFVYYVVVDIE